MSGGISAASIASMAAAAASVVTAYTALKGPKTPGVPTPEKPPQATKVADRGGALTANMAASMPGGASSGNSGTFLTGPSGVDPASLNLGKNSLLGQ
jgi:hypothetical protein